MSKRAFAAKTFGSRTFAPGTLAGAGATPPTPVPAAPPTFAQGGGFLLDPTWGQPRQPKRERKKRRKEAVRRWKPVELPDPDPVPMEAILAARLAAQIEEEDLMLLGICDDVNLFE